MLALIGSGEYLPPMQPVDRCLLEQLPGAPRVACLPTAAGSEGEERVAYWSQLGVQYFSDLGVAAEAVPIIDKASANDPALVEGIHRSNLIYLSGGRPTYLLNSLKDSLAWQAILDTLATGGLLAGCSAGAMVLGEQIPAFPTWKRAFALLPEVVIVPHFEEIPARFTKTMKLFVSRHRTLVGIEGSTALCVQAGHYAVLGQGGVVIWNHSGMARYTQGETIHWPASGGNETHDNSD